MKRKSFFLWSLLAAALTVTSCSDSDVTDGPGGNGETGKFNFSVTLTGSGVTRAEPNRPIPPTDWGNIDNMLFVLYTNDTDPAKRTIVYSDLIENVTKESSKTFQYADVPVGKYVLAIVANAGAANNVKTYTDGTAMTWGAYNIRQKLVSALTISYETGSTGFMTSSLSPFMEPSEIFMAYADLEIEKGKTTTVNGIQLKREVSLARIKIDYTAGEDGVDNRPNVAGGVNYDKNSGILISVLPEDMRITKGDDGGANTHSHKDSAIFVVNADACVFSSKEPEGYKPENMDILDKNYALWREVVVFPNNSKRSAGKESAGADREYFVVISATGLKDHKLANNQVLDAETPIYWGAKVRGAFLPNTVSELNFALKTGGSIDIPDPQDEGILIIELGAPLPWGNNVQEENIDV